jgi:tRNA threonylcarbamoyladenosine biosynthesis protein TsaE
MKLQTRSADETRAVGAALAPLLVPGDVVALEGDLGAGKTTFTQGVARGLGVEDAVLSPTFALVHEYAGPVPVAHVDVYRLDRVQEVYDLGFDELVDGGRVTIVEWGDRIGRMLPADRLVVRLDYDVADADTRVVVVEPVGATWARRSGALAAALEPFTGPR